MFLGLLAFSFSELGLPGLPLASGRSERCQLLLRVAGWGFMFYLPIFVIAAPLVPRSFQPTSCFRWAVFREEMWKYVEDICGKSLGHKNLLLLVLWGIYGKAWGLLGVKDF